MKHEKKIIRNKLRDLLKDGAVRMHMPGHKGKRLKYYYDITEIVGADNLHDPQGIIKEVQEKIADIYGAEESVMLVGSTTAGLQAALMAAAGEGEKVLIPVNAHRSVYSALAFGKMSPVYFVPELKNPGMIVTPESVKELVEKHPDAKALLVVSPDFYGNISDLKEIARILEEKGISLIVDQAHGAHLKFLGGEKDGVSAGADYVVESTHKLLGAPTQGAVLHMQKKANTRQVKKLLAMLESSSPSYMLMAGIEEAIDEAEEKAEDVFKKIYAAHDALMEDQSADDPIRLITPEGDYDKSKFLFQVKDARGIQKRMIEEFRIIPELAYENTLLCMTGIGTSQRDLNRLFGTVKHLNRELKEAGIGPVEENNNKVDGMLKPFNTGMALNEVMGDGGVMVFIGNSVGRIVTDFIVPYPPGIPLLIPGSVITEDDVENLKALIDENYLVTGLESKDGSALIEVVWENVHK